MCNELQRADAHRRAPGPLLVCTYMLLGMLGAWGMWCGLQLRPAPATLRHELGAAPQAPAAPAAAAVTRAEVLASVMTPDTPTPRVATRLQAAAQVPQPPEPGVLPHPITAAHRRIFEENARIVALNGALDQHDAGALRLMNAEYRRDYPEDEQVQCGT